MDGTGELVAEMQQPGVVVGVGGHAEVVLGLEHYAEVKDVGLPDGVFDHGDAALVVDVYVEGVGGERLEVLQQLFVLLLAVQNVGDFGGVQFGSFTLLG